VREDPRRRRSAISLGDRRLLRSARPSTLKEVLPVTLPGPRSFNDPEFIALEARIMDTLSVEVARTMRAERA